MAMEIEHFHGFSQEFVGHSHESVRRKVCPKCRGDRLPFTELSDPADTNGFRTGTVVCRDCGHTYTNNFAPREVRTRLIFRL